MRSLAGLLAASLLVPLLPAGAQAALRTDHRIASATTIGAAKLSPIGNETFDITDLATSTTLGLKTTILAPLTAPVRNASLPLRGGVGLRPAFSFGRSTYRGARLPMAVRDALPLAHRATGRSWLDKATYRRMISTPGPHYILYVSDFINGTVDLYQYNTYQNNHTAQKPFGQISVNTPAGLAVDAAQDLYVVDVQDQLVYEYTPGAMPQASRSLATYPYPQCVAVGPDGSIYVASDGNGNSQQNNAGVVGYNKNGSQILNEVIANPSGYEFSVYGLTVDEKSNVYFNYGSYNSYSASVYEQMPPVEPNGPGRDFTFTNGAYGVKLDGSGNLLTENVATGNIDVYQNGSTVTNGSIAPAISYPVTSANSLAFFDLTYARDNIFYTGSGLSGVPEFAYPSGTADTTINPTGPSYEYGTVISPAAPYPPPFNP